MATKASLRPAGDADDDLLAGHFLAIRRDAPARIRDVLAAARTELGFAAFVAEAGGKPIGSASCRLHRAPYPDVPDAPYRRHGYVRGVFVEPDWRRRGIARRLTAATFDHLRALGCARALLNASPVGRPVHEGMGFQPSNEMRLGLSAP